MLFSDGINTKHISELSCCNETKESCAVQFDYNEKKCIVLAFYGPHSNTIENFNDVINELLQSKACHSLVVTRATRCPSGQSRGATSLPDNI